MKKILLSLILVSFLVFGFVVLAQDGNLPDPGLTPDSPFYFLDVWGEKISLFFTFSPEKKAEKALRYAEEKMAEAKAMAEKNKPEAVETADNNYQASLDVANTQVQEAKAQGKNVEGLAVLITEAILKHQEVLVQVFEKVPEEARTAIQKAIQVSQKGSAEAVQAVSGEKKEELLTKIEETKSNTDERISQLEEELRRAKERIKELEMKLQGQEPSSVAPQPPAKETPVTSTEPGISKAAPTPSTPTPATETPVPTYITQKPTPQPYIQLVSPNGQERWVIGSTYEIKWKASKVNQVNIGLRGADKKWTIISNLPISEGSGSYSWKIEGVDPGHYRVEIKDAGGSTAFDESDILFWVLSSAAVCSDSDGGKDYNVVGTTSGVGTNGETVSNTDSCVTCAVEKGASNSCIREWFCENNFVQETYFPCPAGSFCKDGICQTSGPLTVLSPNGGEQWVIGNTYTIRWDNSAAINGIYLELYRGGTFLAGLGGLSLNYGFPTSWTWNTLETADIVAGSDFKIRIMSDKDHSIYDESDNYFSLSLSPSLPSLATCDSLQANSATYYYFGLCSKGGYDKICFNKYYSTYQGCGRSYWGDYCTAQNVNADKNILCDTGLVYTCTDSDNGTNYSKQGTVNDSGATYSDYCIDNSTLKEYFCSVSDASPSGVVGEENYVCPTGCLDGVCAGEGKKSVLENFTNQFASMLTVFPRMIEWVKGLFK